jgi:hypothetical protein
VFAPTTPAEQARAGVDPERTFRLTTIDANVLQAAQRSMEALEQHQHRIPDAQTPPPPDPLGCLI